MQTGNAMSIQTQNLDNLPQISNTNIVIIQSEWHIEHSNRMLNSCKNLIDKMGKDNKITNYIVPGCWEIPQFLSLLLNDTKSKSSDEKKEKIDAIILFGIILKGGTYHFDMILNTLSQSLAKIIIKSKVPIINEILPVDDINHVIERCGDNDKNKGLEAALACAKMINLIREHRN